MASIDIKNQSLELIYTGHNRIRQGIRRWCESIGKDFNHAEDLKLEAEMIITLTVDELIGQLGLGPDYKEYVAKLHGDGMDD